jgi:hypothetical protein
VELRFPRTRTQISHFAQNVLSRIGDDLEELLITGFYHIHDYDENVSQTVSVAVLDKIKSCCPNLKTLVFRHCRFDLEPAAQDNLPETLKTLKFDNCRYKFNFKEDSVRSIISF